MQSRRNPPRPSKTPVRILQNNLPCPNPPTPLTWPPGRFEKPTGRPADLSRPEVLYTHLILYTHRWVYYTTQVGSGRGIKYPPVGIYVYYCRTYEKAVNGWEGGTKGGHVLRDTTSRGLCGRVGPPHTNHDERRGEGEVVSKEVGEERGARRSGQEERQRHIRRC